MGNTPGQITPPAGFTLDAQPDAAQSGITPPPGFTLDAPAGEDPTSGVSHSTRVARANSTHPNIPTQQEVQQQHVLPGRDGTAQPGVMQNMAEGFGKSAAEGVQGATKLVNKLIMSGSTDPAHEKQIPVPNQNEDLERHGVAQKVGAGAETMGEWAMGEEALGALKEFSTAAKYLKTPTMLADYLKNSPAAARALEAVAHGMSIGGVQGGVHGAANDNAAGGAVGGAVGGGVGAGVGSAVAESAGPLAKILGIGGLTSTEALNKAARPAVSEVNWDKSLETAKPILLDALNKAGTKIKSVGDFEELAHNTADDLWKNTIQPQVDRNANEVLDSSHIMKDIQRSITTTMKKHFPEEAAQIESFANTFKGTTTLGELNESLAEFNARLRNYYKAPPQQKAAIIKTDEDVKALEQAAVSARDLIYSRLEDLKETTPAALRQQYGALKDVERVFGKRATVADRQAPLDFKQAMALIAGSTEAGAAFMAGHPLAAVAGLVPFAVTTASKMRQAPESLIRQGMSAAAREAAPSATKAAVGSAAKSATAAAGSQAGQWIQFTGTDGKKYSVHPDDFEEAKKRGLVSNTSK